MNKIKWCQISLLLPLLPLYYEKYSFSFMPNEFQKLVLPMFISSTVSNLAREEIFKNDTDEWFGSLLIGDQLIELIPVEGILWQWFIFNKVNPLI